MFYIMPSHDSKASTCVSIEYSHFTKNKHFYLHNFNKFNEFQISLKGLGEIRI
jgi:hypothetical protein